MRHKESLCASSLVPYTNCDRHPFQIAAAPLPQLVLNPILPHVRAKLEDAKAIYFLGIVGVCKPTISFEVVR